MKRFFDLLFSIIFLVILFVPLLIISLLVYLKLGNPIFFVQVRPGIYGKPFKLVKFRTMTNTRDLSGNLLSDSQRITPFGRWLRATSIDELPELFNILRGEMSFIGPRPLLMQYLPLYSAEQARRHDVKPGFSGWAQINGRNAISWDEKLSMDVWYVDHQSFMLDLRILVFTFWTVLCCEGISAPGETTVAPFTGSSSRQ